MKTRKVDTRFMNGNIDVEGEIFSILCANYSMPEIFDTILGNDDIIYSDGFILAIENGLIPSLENIQEAFLPKTDKEYHHFIFEDECYIAYFN